MGILIEKNSKKKAINRIIQHGAKTLQVLKSKIDIDKMKEPSFMMILNGVGSYAYRRGDGIYVVPIGCHRD